MISTVGEINTCMVLVSKPNKLTMALGGGLAGSKPKSGGRFCSLMYLGKNTFLPFRSVARTWQEWKIITTTSSYL